MERQALICYVNGVRRILPRGRGECTLLEYLRGDLGLTGAKLGCGEGGCGACTVMVSHLHPLTKQTVHKSVNACLCPLYYVEGMHVITVEGIGSTRNGLHPVQERLAHAHGSQCGFCTPGFVMSMYSLLRMKNGQNISEEEIEENMAGNLCRCTGYRPILEAFRPFVGAYTEDSLQDIMIPDSGVQNGKISEFGSTPICPSTGKPCSCSNSDGSESGIQNQINGFSARSKGELIFPPELQERVAVEFEEHGDVVSWYRPVTLESLLQLKADYPNSKIVAGNTEIGIEMKFKHAGYKRLISAAQIPELMDIKVSEESTTFGSSVTLTDLLSYCRNSADLPQSKRSFLHAIAEQLKWFAGPPIRNSASIGGNVVTASPISDLNPLWISSGSNFHVRSQARGARAIKADEFFKGYRKVDMLPDEVLIGIELPFSRKFEYLMEFKQAQRRDDDIAIVNAGITLGFQCTDQGQWVVKNACFAYGGVAPMTVSAKNTAEILVGRHLNTSNLVKCLHAVKEEVNIDSNAPGGRIEFRRALVVSFLLKALVNAGSRLAEDTKNHAFPFQNPFEPKINSSCKKFERIPSKGLQYFSLPGEGDIVGQPSQHASAALQTSGEAQYVDDIPKAKGTLHAALILSEKPHARIKGIETTGAYAVPGVIAVHLAGDIPGDNHIGPVAVDEELFATDTVTCVGQPVGVVTAETRTAALEAARSVTIMYEELPSILTIEEAISHSSKFQYNGCEVNRGDVDQAFTRPDLIIAEGVVRLGGQEHFYLEPNAHLVVPGDGGEIVSYSSTQCPEKGQKYIAHCLGIPSHKVVVKTKRIGGGFGGKETRAAFVNAAAAIPAYLLNRSVSIVLDRDVDMSITGHRHPFMAYYKAACTRDGELVACDIQMYSNAGNSLDLSGSVMDRALLSADSVYNIPHFRATGTVCKTNLPSNTAFRGFGGPQGMAIMENILDKLAAYSNIDINKMKAKNMYHEGDVTPYGMVLDGCQARRCWEEAIQSAGGLEERQKKVEEFNSNSMYRKRGLAVTPTKFGISFTTKFLNQAGALVHIYKEDGTVLVSHGGVEMGQGLHTKVCQIVAQELGVPLEKVHISETATDKVPNASPTAASASSDMYGAAAANACKELNQRLEPIRETMPGASFEDVVRAAYFDRIDLSAHGFYRTPNITGAGGTRPFNYLTYGVAITEVELDTLTGDFHVIRSDVVMDVGKSINPAIDIGQVEGAFVQGMGWSCTEELVWGDSAHPWIPKQGSLFTCGPGTYKIPSVNDIPIDFRVTLLRNAPCVQTPLVHSSKAVGEPPFFLGTSVFWALKDAIYAHRKSAGFPGWFALDAPSTPERLRMLCQDMALHIIDRSEDRPYMSC